MNRKIVLIILPSSAILIGFAVYYLFANPIFEGSFQANGILSAIYATAGLFGLLYSYGVITQNKNQDDKNGN